MPKTIENIAEVIGKWVADANPYPTSTMEIEKMLTWYYGAGGYIAKDVKIAERLMEELRKQTEKEKPKKYSVEDVRDLPDVPDSGEIGCFVNVEKMVSKDEKQIFTFRVTAKNTSIHHEVLKALPNTQPTLDFQDKKLKTWSEIFLSLKALLERYVYFRNQTTYAIIALVAASSYFREVFSAYPYVDYVAIEVNCGKTTALQATCWASFYGFVTITPTPAVIYRTIDQCKGVLGIDEIDNALTNKDQRGAITGILNAGYKKGIFAQRCAPRTNEVENYDPFGIKGFSRVKWIPRSIVDRSIQIPMMRASEHIKLEDLETSDSFREVRDALYGLRLHHSDQVREMVSWTRNDCGLTGRDRELFLAPLTIAKLVGAKVYDEALEWAKDYITQKRSQADDPRMVVLVEVLLSHLGQPDVASTGIRDEYYALLEERSMLAENEKRARSVNKYLDRMGLRRSDKKTDNKTYFDIDRTITLQWAKYYGFNLSAAQLQELDKLDNSTHQASISTFYREREEGSEKGAIPTPNLPNSSNSRGYQMLVGRLASLWKKTGLKPNDQLSGKHIMGLPEGSVTHSHAMLEECIKEGLVISQHPEKWRLTDLGKIEIEGIAQATVDKNYLRLQKIWKRAGLENIDDFLLDTDREKLSKRDRGFLTAQIDKKHVVQEKAGQWVLSETVKTALQEGGS